MFFNSKRDLPILTRRFDDNCMSSWSRADWPKKYFVGLECTARSYSSSSWRGEIFSSSRAFRIFTSVQQSGQHRYYIMPGRVVTLVKSEDPNSAVWGVAYKIREEDVDNVTKHLDFREKNGYSKKIVTFHPKDSIEPFNLTLYIATEENESYAGPAPIDDIARQVVESVGPSGPNKEYVYNLAKAMKQLAPNVSDDHLFALEASVRQLDPEFNIN